MFKEIPKKYANMALPVKAGMWFMICNTIPQVITVLMTTIFTRILSTNDYGISSNYSAWYNILSIFITLNLNCDVYNNAMLKYEDKRDAYDSATMGLSLLLGVIGFTIIMIFQNPLSHIFSLPSSLLLCLALQCLLYNSYGCWVSRVKYEYNYKYLILVTLIVSICSPLLSVVFIYISEDKAIGKVWGQNIIYIILGIIFYLLAFFKNKKLYNKEYWTFALKFSLPLIPHYLSLIILNQSDKVMITSMCGASENGLYSLAYSAASLLLIFNSSFTQSLIPWCYKNMKNKNTTTMKKVINSICCIYVGIDLLFIIVAPEVIAILAGAKYVEAIYVIPPVAASMYLILLYNIYCIFEFYYEQTKSVMICSTVSAVLNIVLNYLFIPRYGYLAAGYTTLVCYLLNSVMHIVVLKKLQSQHGILGVSIRCSFGVGLLLIIVSIGITYLYQFSVLRWSIFIFIFIIVILKRNYFITLIKKIRSK